MRRFSLGWELVFAVLAITAAVPIWIVKYPPIQDLPQHLAAIRVLHDYGNPDLGFAQFFELHLGRTQYLTYYVAAHLLAYPLGVFTANKVLFTAAVVSLPYASRSLLESLGRDQRMALFVLPLAWTTHTLLGFLNFSAAIPLMLWGLAIAVRLRFEWDTRRALTLAAVSLVTFYTHIVPFGFLALGAGLIALGGSLRTTGLRLLPLLPSVIGVFGWLRTSPAAQAVLGASKLGSADVHAEYYAFSRSIKELGLWLFDVLPGEVDDQLLIAWALLIVATLVMGSGAAVTDEKPSEVEVLEGSLARRLALLAPLAFAAYFIAPNGYDWIWPINARFPVIGVVLLLCGLPTPRRGFALPIFAGAALVSLLFSREIGSAFKSYAREELGNVDAALTSIPKGQKVVGLIWDRDSKFVKGSPFVHAAALYQASRGGAVMFSFAEYPQSPFSFKRESRPPQVPRKWEWTPHYVRPVPDLDWFDYVLTRGDPGVMPGYGDAFEPIFQDVHWRVYKRRDPSQPFESPDTVLRMIGDANIVPAKGTSCFALVAGKDPALMLAVRDLLHKATEPKGGCQKLEAGRRSCELTLAGAHIQLDFQDGALVPGSLSCNLAG